jgi:transposase
MPIILKFKQITASKLFELAAKERDRQLKRRILGIALSAEGRLSREAIAKQLKTDSDRIRAWIVRYNADGLDGLHDIPGRGDKPTMTARQEKALGKALERSPRDVGVNSNIWTGRAVQEFLTHRGWFECSLGGAYAIIHRLGFTLQRPNRQPLEAEPKAAKRFLRQLAGEKKAAP